MKKGQKRWFIIKNGKLLWFNKMQSDVGTTANNYAILASSTVTPMTSSRGNYPFKLITKKGNASKEYVLIASSERETKDWLEALVAAGATGNSAITTPSSPRDLSANGGNVRASAPPLPSTRPGSASKRGSMGDVALAFSAPASSVLPRSDSPGVLFRSSSAKDNMAKFSQAADPLSAFNKALPDKKSGWLQKKGILSFPPTQVI